MFKLLLILIVGLVFEAAGVVLLKQGINQVGELQKITFPEIVRVTKAGISNPLILGGIFFEALFFGSLLYLLSKSDVTFVWPLTALSFVMTTFAALLFLNEHVSGVRWAGVTFIVLGAALISYSEHIKPKAPSSPATAS